MNLRKDHCRNLPSRTTRELVSKRGAEGSCGSSSPLSRGGCVALARPTLPGVQTNTGANCAKEIERESASPSPPETVCEGGVVIFKYVKTTLGNGYLGSRIDEERSEMRYLV